MRPYRFAVISIVRSVSSVGFGLLGIWLGWGGMGLLAAFGLGSLTGIILNLVGDRTKIARFERSQFVQLARYGLPLTLAGLSFALYSTCDRLIVAWLLGRDAAGIFGVAADLPRQFMVMVDVRPGHRRTLTFCRSDRRQPRPRATLPPAPAVVYERFVAGPCRISPQTERKAAAIS